MIEVEVKVSVKNKKEIEKKLLHMGFLKGDLLKESDFYFDSECSNLRKNDKALRIRRCENLTTNSTENRMTFKGPKMDTVSMTRKELEMQVESAETGKEILMSLGFTPIHPVIKLRQYFYLDKVTACLDIVENLGAFLELEIVVPQEDEKGDALNKIILLLHELGYGQEAIIRRSYLTMLQNENKH